MLIIVVGQDENYDVQVYTHSVVRSVMDLDDCMDVLNTIKDIEFTLISHIEKILVINNAKVVCQFDSEDIEDYYELYELVDDFDNEEFDTAPVGGYNNWSAKRGEYY